MIRILRTHTRNKSSISSDENLSSVFLKSYPYGSSGQRGLGNAALGSTPRTGDQGCPCDRTMGTSCWTEDGWLGEEPGPLVWEEEGRNPKAYSILERCFKVQGLTRARINYVGEKLRADIQKIVHGKCESRHGADSAQAHGTQVGEQSTWGLWAEMRLWSQVHILGSSEIEWRSRIGPFMADLLCWFLTCPCSSSLSQKILQKIFQCEERRSGCRCQTLWHFRGPYCLPTRF